MTKPPRTSSRRPRPEPQRSNRVRAVADLLPDVGRAAFRKFGFVQHSIVSRWSEIVGERYARVSMPESIRFPQGKRADGVLHLVVRATPRAPWSVREIAFGDVTEAIVQVEFSPPSPGELELIGQPAGTAGTEA